MTSICNKSNCLTIIRPTVIFGEQNHGNVYNLLRQIAGGKFPMIGKGTNRKSMNLSRMSRRSSSSALKTRKSFHALKRNTTELQTESSTCSTTAMSRHTTRTILCLTYTSISESRRSALCIFRTGLHISVQNVLTCLLSTCTGSLQSTQSV